MAVIVLAVDPLYIDTSQFRLEFLGEAGIQLDAFLQGTVQHSRKFIPGHGPIANKPSAGIAFHDAPLLQVFQICVGPMVFRYIREHGCVLDLLLRSYQFIYQLGELGDLGILMGNMFLQFHDFVSHSRTGSSYPIHPVQGEAYAGVHHVFPVAYGTAYGEHNLFVRTVEGANGGCILAPVVAHACRKGQLVIRVKVHRMQRSQCRSTSQAFLHTAVQTVHFVAYVVDGISGTICQFTQLTHVGSVRICFTGSYIGDLLAACVQTVLCNGRTVCNGKAVVTDSSVTCGEGIGRYAVVGDDGIACSEGISRYAVVGDDGIAHRHLIVFDGSVAYGELCILAVNGNVVAGLQRLVHLNGIHAFDVFGQLNVQGIAVAFHADVSVAQCAGSTAFDIQGVAQFDLVAGPAIALKGQAILFHFIQRRFGGIAEIYLVVGHVVGIFFAFGHRKGLRACTYRCAVCVHRVDALPFLSRGVFNRSNVGAALYFRPQTCGGFLQLVHIHCIGACHTGRYAGDLLIPCIDAVPGYGRPVHDGETVAVHGSIAYGNFVGSYAVVVDGGVACGDAVGSYAVIVDGGVACGDLICRYGLGSYGIVGDEGIPHGDLVLFDGGIAYAYLPVFDHRIPYGNFVSRYTVVVDNGVACSDTVHLQILGEFHFDLVIFRLGGNVASVAYDLQGLVVAAYHLVTVIAPEFQFHAADSLFFGFIQLAYVHSVCIIFAVCYVFNLLTACTDSFRCKLNNVRTGCGHDPNTLLTEYRTAVRKASNGHGSSVTIHGNVVAHFGRFINLDTVDVFDVLRQFHFQGIAFCRYTDIAVSQDSRCTAGHVQGIP